MQFLAALIAVCKTIPALTGFAKWATEQMQAWDKARNERIASERLESKNSAVDSAIDAVRVFQSPAPQQLTATDSTARLSGSGTSSTGVVPGRAEDSQSTGA